MGHNNSAEDINWDKVLTKLNRESHVEDPEIQLNPEEQRLFTELSAIKLAGESYNDVHSFNTEEKLLELKRAIQPAAQPRIKIVSWSRYIAAAVLLCFLSIGFLFYLKNRNQEYKTAQQATVKPGGNEAYLTLADGRLIVLTDVANGEIATQSGIKITKTSDGQLFYELNDTEASVKGGPEYNTIQTPRGGQYQLRLPDGSRVWLNAASSLKFPASFASDERKVELQGEAYFEVAKDKSKPFLVQSAGQMVEVLGTHFNVSAYQDEPAIKTTLIEGSVKVLNLASKQSKVLLPGQQSFVQHQVLSTKSVDPEEAIAWKNGFFKFESQTIESIMKQVSRWYDVEIIYKNGIGSKTFSGAISRYADVTEVIKMLEYTELIHFKIEGRRITVMP